MHWYVTGTTSIIIRLTVSHPRFSARLPATCLKRSTPSYMYVHLIYCAKNSFHTWKPQMSIRFSLCFARSTPISHPKSNSVHTDRQRREPTQQRWQKNPNYTQSWMMEHLCHYQLQFAGRCRLWTRTAAFKAIFHQQPI